MPIRDSTGRKQAISVSTVPPHQQDQPGALEGMQSIKEDCQPAHQRNRSSPVKNVVGQEMGPKRSSPGREIWSNFFFFF